MRATLPGVHPRRATAATEAARDQATRRRRLAGGAAEIALAVGQVIGKRKVKKHFQLVMADKRVAYNHNQEQVAEEAALDSFYVLGTNLAAPTGSVNRMPIGGERIGAAATACEHRILWRRSRHIRATRWRKQGPAHPEPSEG